MFVQETFFAQLPLEFPSNCWITVYDSKLCTAFKYSDSGNSKNIDVYYNNFYYHIFHSTGISMTDSSGKPYNNGHGHGSVISMNTTTTNVSNVSTVDSSLNRSPLRSSLKKPRNNGLGIQNPGFSGSNQSPRFNRAGSVKKVRIQTHSTEV